MASTALMSPRGRVLTQLLREHPEVRHELQRLMREVFPGYDVLKFQRKRVFAEAKPGQPRAQDVGLVCI